MKRIIALSAIFLLWPLILQAQTNAGQTVAPTGDTARNAVTLNEGLKQMARDIPQKNVFIVPPTTGSSREVTQFASAVKDHLSLYINTSPALASAAYLMTGEYVRSDNVIELTYRIMDHNHHTIKTVKCSFQPAAYRGYETRPTALGFEDLIHSGLIISHEFTVDIKTSEGRSGLLYKKGDTMTLFIKLNSPGYFYIMGHTFKEDTYSYLIHLNNYPGPRKFISHIGPENAGKWVSLGEFKSVPPFGVETLQIIASSEDLKNSVPETFLDTKTQLYTVGTSAKTKLAPADAVLAARDLMAEKKKKAAFAEASLTVSTTEE